MMGEGNLWNAFSLPSRSSPCYVLGFLASRSIQNVAIPLILLPPSMAVYISVQKIKKSFAFQVSGFYFFKNSTAVTFE